MKSNKIEKSSLILKSRNTLNESSMTYNEVLKKQHEEEMENNYLIRQIGAHT